MGRFLARLFRYRERAKISPLEDFLSEALAGLLDKMPSAQARQFVQACLVPDTLVSAFQTLVQEQSIECQTQVRTPDGHRMDLVLSMGERPAIVIESKIGSPIQVHRRVDPDGDDGATEAEETQNEEDAERIEEKTQSQLQTCG